MDLNMVLMKLAKAMAEQMIGLTRKNDGATESIIVTENRKIYKCVLDYANKASFEEKMLSNEDYEKIVALLDETLNKTEEYQSMSNAKYELCINYKNVRWSVKNDKALEMCEMIQALLTGIWESSGESKVTAEAMMHERVNTLSKYRERMEKILDKALLDVYCVWGNGAIPGCSGTIVTSDKKIYKYAGYNHRYAIFQKNDIIETKELNEQEYAQIVNFIENEILNKEYEDYMIYDVSFIVKVNYNGVTKKIENNTEHETKSGIYDIATKLLQEIWDNSIFIAEKTEYPPEKE